MPTIVLMRHAQAELASPGMRDFDRPLSAEGWAETAIAAKLLQKTGVKPTRAICSPARRTMETLGCLRGDILIDAEKIRFLDELYSGDVASYQAVANEVLPDDVCLIVGHNPMVERFAMELATDGQQEALAFLKQGFPTAAIVVVKFGIAKSGGLLQHFLVPSN